MQAHASTMPHTLILLVFSMLGAALANTTRGRYVDGDALHGIVNADDFNQGEFMMDICPGHADLCDTGKNVSTDSHCCICDCLDNCLTLGTCCENKTHNPRQNVADRHVTENGETCISTTLGTTTYQMSYLMVADCIEQFTNQTVIEKCSRYGLFIEPSETIPVYDPASYLHYANIYCAICNNVLRTTTLIHWIPEARCNSLNTSLQILRRSATSTVIDVMQEFLLANCSISLKTDAWTDPCLLSEHIITKCNDAYKSVYPANSNIYRLCESENVNIFRHESFVYKNVFCALCNVEYMNLIETCLNRNTYIDQFRDDNSMSFLLDMAGKLSDYVSVNESPGIECEQPAVYNVQLVSIGLPY